MTMAICPKRYNTLTPPFPAHHPNDPSSILAPLANPTTVPSYRGATIPHNFRVQVFVARGLSE
jgi:hypothetical protein